MEDSPLIRKRNILTTTFFGPSSPIAAIFFLFFSLGLAYLYLILPNVLNVRFPNDEEATWINNLSVLGYVFPKTFFQSALLFKIFEVFFVVSGILWFAHLLLPYSAWICTGSFLLFTSIYIQNSYYTPHMIHPVTTGLTIACALYSWHWRTLRKVFLKLFGGSDITSDDHVPLWWYSLYVSWVAITYSLSGINKLIQTGFNWADGVSLQLWLKDVEEQAAGPVGVFLNGLIAEHFVIAYVAQLTVFVVELTCLLILPFRTVRLIYGSILVGFHLVCNLTMGFHFWSAVALNGYMLVWLAIFTPRRSTKKSLL